MNASAPGLALRGLAIFTIVSLVAVLLGGTLWHPQQAQALPMYAQRSGRTCGNCHISPTWERPEGFENPTLAQRKCNMSCLVCHTDPTGGGLRNTSGRYYGRSTLSMLPTQERSYSDSGRELFGNELRYNFLQRFATLPEPAPDGRNIPVDYDEVLEFVGAGRTGGTYVAGKPLGSPSKYAFWDGRYGAMNADPLLQFGADLRSAYWTGSKTFFPMQLDLHGAVHPVEHITVTATAAARGRTSGPVALITQEQTPVFVRKAFVMVHELPYMAYAKAGLFLPAFGTYIDDHTSFTRNFFEMDVSTSDDNVLGAEIGVAPNYPHLSVSAFKNHVPYGVDPGTDPGYGVASSFGWRDLGWSVTGSLMAKRRDLDARGDLDAASLGWGFNPMYFSNHIPLTYMGELAVGRRERAVVGTDARFVAMYHELWWTIFNGASLRAKYDVGDRDVDVAGQLQHRYSLALDVSPIPGMTFIAQGRLLVLPEASNPGTDLFVQTHLWF